MAVEHLLNILQAEFPNLFFVRFFAFMAYDENIRGQEVSLATLGFAGKSWHC